MAHFMNSGFYQAVIHQDNEGFWIALYDTRRSLRENQTALEADLLLESDEAGPEAAQSILREQLGLAPIEPWQPVTTRYGQGWRALFGADVRSAAA
ncbi:MAG: hypothetical protein ACRC20_15250 [Segniliparus sp.]|uniref:hypothetical protein n=1 Tax=Segniliparus sp. TaxID=2804064 RepID=UPI003F36EE96